MNRTVVPFRSKARSYPTPHDMLRDLARIDATLIYRVIDDGGVHIGFEVPREAHADFHAILSMLDRCDDAWRVHYLVTVQRLLDIDEVSSELPTGFVRRLKLRTAFVVPFPSTGAEAMRLFYELNADARELAEQGLQHEPRWLSVSSRCDDLLRTLLTAKGTAFGIEVAAEAHRLATEFGIDLGVVR